MHRLIRFLWITSIFRKHRSHRHLRVLHTKTFFPQKLSTLMWISALSGVVSWCKMDNLDLFIFPDPIPCLAPPLQPTTTNPKTQNTPRG